MEKIKRVYKFGADQTEGKAEMRELLGGKGANLAEMSLIGIPVPPGFTITTQACIEYNTIGKEKAVELLCSEVEEGMHSIENVMGSKFGDQDNPCLVSVRSGARVSMPGMMDTVLNIGLNDNAVEGLLRKTKNERFVYDSYRRFIQMYGDVVMGLKPASKEDADPFEEILDQTKKAKGIEKDEDLTADDFKQLAVEFKKTIKRRTGKEFPDDPWEQLWGAIMAVFDSWMIERAVSYRRIHGIPGDWGTAVNVQAMVYGNMGDNSATGVAFTRDAATGENKFNGEFLINAQGEDVVAGTRTPRQMTKESSLNWAKMSNVSEEERRQKYLSLEETMPQQYNELIAIRKKLEEHYTDMQDIEFTIQEGKLWMLQTRTAKRTGAAMVKIAIDMLKEGLIDEKTAIMRIDDNKLDELLHPVFGKESIRKAKLITKGLPASPGAATGQIVFFADEAEAWAQQGKEVILVRNETSPEDINGMHVANGILTARGGMTSHAAVVARGMGKCCVSGVGSMKINYKDRSFTVKEVTYKQGEWISLNGTTGEIYLGKIETIDPEINNDFTELMNLAEKYSSMYVRANADTPEDAVKARAFGAKGIGLCRTEHMFFEGERITAMREMILANDKSEREEALKKLLPMQREDFEGLFEAMHDLPVTVRLLDPPLNEFVPHGKVNQQEMADEMGVPFEVIRQKVKELQEANPMLGHRGCRLGNTYPEITRMQTRAIIEAALNLKRKGIKAMPEIMVPLIGSVEEMVMQKQIVTEEAEKIFHERHDRIDYLVGTMIEVPRAALTADKVARQAQFFSFGTNDLTQMTYGLSRDDTGKLLPVYIKKGLLQHNPFEILDREGVGLLVKMAVEKGRKSNPKLKIGICGEHGGEPKSIEFCYQLNLNYVSCSPYRVPIARLATAQAAIKSGQGVPVE